MYIPPVSSNPCLDLQFREWRIRHEGELRNLLHVLQRKLRKEDGREGEERA